MIKAFVLFTSGLLFSTVSFGADTWRLAKEAEGVQVYIRPVPGSDFSELRGITKVKTSLASLVAIWSSPETFIDWMYTCLNASLLKKETAKSLYIYIVSAVPWPLHNRDNILFADLSQNGKDKKVTIILTGKPDYVEKKKEMVRVVQSFGKVELIPLENQEIQVVFEFFMNPGGAIPAPITNLLLVDFPFFSLKKMRDVVQEPKYQNAKFDFIQEIDLKKMRWVAE